MVSNILYINTLKQYENLNIDTFSCFYTKLWYGRYGIDLGHTCHAAFIIMGTDRRAT